MDSLQLTLKLTIKNKEKVLKICYQTKLAHTLTIRELAKLIGNLVASMDVAL